MWLMSRATGLASASGSTHLHKGAKESQNEGGSMAAIIPSALASRGVHSVPVKWCGAVLYK